MPHHYYIWGMIGRTGILWVLKNWTFHGFETALSFSLFLNYSPWLKPVSHDTTHLKIRNTMLLLITLEPITEAINLQRHPS